MKLMQRQLPIICAVFVIVSLSLPSPCAAGGASARPNVLLLTVDTLRADRLSVYGYKRRTSPRLDSLMKKGIRFENAYTVEPLTAPSFSSVMMSRYPHETGLTRNGLRVRVKFSTLAELLKNAGYITGAVQSNWTVRAALTGLDRGFDFYEDSFTRPRTPVVTERIAKNVTKIALQWLNTIRKGEKFFLWAHYSDPHSPYVLHPNFRFPTLKGENFLSPSYRYDSEVAYADYHIGRLLDGMRRDGMLKNTMIFFTADHGESLGEHGYYGHGRQLYQPMLKVPMAVIGPGIRGGMVTKIPAQLIDVMPTILRLLGLEPPEGIRGRPLVGLDGLPRKFERPERYFETYRGAVHNIPIAKQISTGAKPMLLGMMRGKWKCIHSPEKNKTELYNIEADPGEMNNLAFSRPDIAGLMVNKTLKWFTSTHPYIPRRRPVLSKGDREKLKALGYIQ